MAMLAIKLCFHRPQHSPERSLPRRTAGACIGNRATADSQLLIGNFRIAAPDLLLAGNAEIQITVLSPVLFVKNKCRGVGLGAMLAYKCFDLSDDYKHRRKQRDAAGQTML